MKENFQNVAFRRRHVVLGAFQVEVAEPDFPAEEKNIQKNFYWTDLYFQFVYLYWRGKL